MASRTQIRGAKKLKQVGVALKAAGDKELKKETFRGLARAVKPVKETAKKSPHLSPGLPRRGGLADQVAKDLKGKGGIKIRRSLSGKRPRIAITATWSGHDIAAMNRGRLRHPVYGNRKVWVNQKIPKRFYDKPVRKEIRAAAKEVNKVLDEVTKKIARMAR